jgi:hypothetical protein
MEVRFGGALIAVLVPCVLGAAIGQADSEATSPASLAQFEWLEGSWERQVRGGVATESWIRVSENTMEGIATVTRGDEERTTEHLRIGLFGDRIYYTALPQENAMPTSFELVEATEDRWTFENPDHDFPQRIIYARHAAGRLSVRIEGLEDSSDSGVDFEFTRSREEAELEPGRS